MKEINCRQIDKNANSNVMKDPESFAFTKFEGSSGSIDIRKVKIPIFWLKTPHP